MKNILDILKLTKREESLGVWLSGIKLEGEFKKWHNNGQLYIYSNWENKKKHGIEKIWDMNGNLTEHELWENGKVSHNYLYYPIPL